MFDEVYGRLSSSKNSFESNVQDRFGKSLVYDGYDPFLSQVSKLISTWNDAESKMNNIKSMLEQLRSIN